MKGNLIKSRAIKEAIREIDTEDEETEYAKSKLKNKFDFFNVEARNLFLKSKVTTSMIKCTHGINPYGVQNEMISKK